MVCEKITLTCFTGLIANMYDDPVQGNQDNCALIAAMSSVAWVTQRKKLICTYDSGTKKFKATFSNPTVVVEVTNYFDSLDAHSYQTEAWVAVYEKAYAKQYLGCKDPCCPIQLGERISWPGNACDPIKYLSGCSPVLVTSGFYSAISGICIDGKTKWPTVIWTKENPEKPDKVIRARHSYSVLGFVDPYVILRDPKRSLPNVNPADSPNCLLQGTYTFPNNFVGAICPGTSWTPGPSILIEFGKNGIFGVKYNKCTDNIWFAGMCYGSS